MNRRSGIVWDHTIGKEMDKHFTKSLWLPSADGALPACVHKKGATNPESLMPSASGIPRWLHPSVAKKENLQLRLYRSLPHGKTITFRTA
jgi:hypothetical protein